MKKFLLLFLLFLSPIVSSFPSDTYGAIAYNAGSDRYGYSSGYKNKYLARAAARRRCGHNCVVVVWFKNGCGALATTVRVRGHRKGYAGRWAKYSSVARSRARSKCRRMNGRSCIVRKSICSWSRSDYRGNRSDYNPSSRYPRNNDSRNKYGAIAYNPSSQRAGSASHYRSQRQANRAAKRKCGYGNCRIVVRFRNACGALARGRSKYDRHRHIYAGGWSVNRRTARSKARRACYRRGGRSCRILKTTCSK